MENPIKALARRVLRTDMEDARDRLIADFDRQYQALQNEHANIMKGKGQAHQRDMSTLRGMLGNLEENNLAMRERAYPHFKPNLVPGMKIKPGAEVQNDSPAFLIGLALRKCNEAVWFVQNFQATAINDGYLEVEFGAERWSIVINPSKNPTVN